MLWRDDHTGANIRDRILPLLAVTVIFAGLLSSGVNAQINDDEKIEILFFYSLTCPHCAEERKFLEQLEEKYPRLDVKYFESSANWDFFVKTCRRYNTSTAGVPRTFIGDKVFIGYESHDCESVWYQGYLGYVGCPNQIEIAIRNLMNLSTMLSKMDALDIARRDRVVCNLTALHNDVVANVYISDNVYSVSWWTPERIKSDINYPNVLVTIDAKTGEILKSEIPDSKIDGIIKPSLPGTNYVILSIVVLIMLVSIAYMVIGSKIRKRYWVSLFAFLVIIFLFAYLESLPSMNVVEYAKQFSFPIFTFIIAIVDGFNPCAFAVLAFLLSILTHTKSRKKMLLIGSIFILTSGLMYFLFIMVLLFLRTELLGGYKDIIRITVAVIAMIAGLINIKDFFFFKKGISLTMSPEKQGKIFKKIGKLGRNIETAKSKRDMFFVIIATIILAVMVNLVELGCTFILPMEYIETLIVNYPGNQLAPILFTAFYCAVYILPLFAILGSFIYSFKSERVNEIHGRVLKLIGGLVMVSLGLILIFKPGLLMF